MNASTATRKAHAGVWLLVVYWLIWDTFRQSLASRIFWLMLGVSGLCVVFCLSTSVKNLPTKEEAPELITRKEAARFDEFELSRSGVTVIDEGEVRFLFGAVRVEYTKHREDAVRWVQLVLAAFVADILGLLLALIWTAAFLPTFLEPSSVSVLLAKPVPRWSLLAGKYLGVLIFVAFQAFVFVLGTWLALAIRTGVWDAHYLWCIPLLVLHFAIFFSFSCMLAVWTRSTIVCVFGSLLFWGICWGVNYGRHAALATPANPTAQVTAATSTTAVGAVAPGGSVGDAPARVASVLAAANRNDSSPAPKQVAPGASLAMELGYWVLPKPADVHIVLRELLGAEELVGPVPDFAEVKKQGKLHLEWSLLASGLFALVMLAVAGYEFVKADY